jgi:hypothetical protein
LKSSNGVVLFRARSIYNGEKLVAIMTGLNKPSANVKVGPSYQIFILTEDKNPMDALKSGDDATICGDCLHRGSSCYVQVQQAPNTVWEAYRRGNYPDVDWEKLRFRKQLVRLGAYGDPGIVPFEAWGPLFEAIKRAKIPHTGYTHAWRYCDERYRRVLQASVDFEEDLVVAQSAGWRTFRVMTPGSALAPGEFLCPASTESAHKFNTIMTCGQCMTCNGKKDDADQRGSPAIYVHGNSSRKLKFTGLTVGAT